MNELDARHDLIDWRFAKNKRQFHLYKQLATIVIDRLAKIDGRDTVKQYRRRINTDDHFRVTMWEDRFIDHDVYAGTLVPVVGHRPQNIVEYSVIQHFKTLCNNNVFTFMLKCAFVNSRKKAKLTEGNTIRINWLPILFIFHQKQNL